MRNLAVNSLKRSNQDTKMHFVIWFCSYLAGFTIIWGYNIYHADENFGQMLLLMLKNSDTIMSISVILISCWWHWKKKNLTKNVAKIAMLVIATSVFTFANFDNVVCGYLWNEYKYPSSTIFINIHNNMPPIDPFQILMLVFLSYFKDRYEKILGWLVGKINFKKYIITIA